MGLVSDGVLAVEVLTVWPVPRPYLTLGYTGRDLDPVPIFRAAAGSPVPALSHLVPQTPEELKLSPMDD